MTTQVGGDSPQTMPVAVSAGMVAGQIRQASAQAAAANGPKFSMDAFVKGLKQLRHPKEAFRSARASTVEALKPLGKPGEFAAAVKQGTIANVPLSDALSQQNLLTRLAARFPFVKGYLGPDYILNQAIGSLPNSAGPLAGLRQRLPFWKPPAVHLDGISKAKVTKIALEGVDVANKLQKIGVPPELADKVAKATLQRQEALELAKQTAQQATLAASQRAVQQLTTEALKLQLRDGGLGYAKPTAEKVAQALAQGGKAGKQALLKMGFFPKDAARLVNSAAVGQVANAGGNSFMAGARKLAGNLLSGAKGSFVLAGVFSFVTNIGQVAGGQMTFPQFVGLSAMDTAAYGTIGLGAGAAGAAIGTLIPVPLLGTVAGFAIGFAAGWLYEKVLRDPVKAVLGFGQKPSGTQKTDAPVAASPTSPPSAASQSTERAADPYKQFQEVYNAQLKRLEEPAY